jgi:hypothetical protein
MQFIAAFPALLFFSIRRKKSFPVPNFAIAPRPGRGGQPNPCFPGSGGELGNKGGKVSPGKGSFHGQNDHLIFLSCPAPAFLLEPERGLALDHPRLKPVQLPLKSA